MPSVTFNDFSGGLDLRLPINVQDASRLWVLRNAYVTLGRRLKKRPCLKRLADYTLTGSYGLENVNGQLAVFVPRGSPITLPTAMATIQSGTSFKPLVTQYQLDIPSIADASANLIGINYADIFQGYPYVVAKYLVQYSPSMPNPTQLAYYHHYVDTNPSTLIADVNCPRTPSATKAASRIFAINGETVRYCAAGAARNWTTASDAGFLPVALQQDTKEPCTAVGTFQDSLVVFFPEGAQIWDVAVDPSANQIRKRIYGVGTNYPMTLASWALDLGFLSQFGFRSMTVAANTDRIDDTDLGVPIDAPVVDDIATSNALSFVSRIEPFGAWIPQLGQYWCVFDNGVTSKVWAYSFSKSAKIGCWSEYTLPVRATALASLGGKVYLRTASALYEIDAGTFTDDGTPVPVEVQMAFQDAKSPGVSKQFTGADYVMVGGADVSFKYDPRDLGKESIPQNISGDTRPGDVIPVEIQATALAPVFRHQADEDFELTQATFYFQVLGAIR
ncbi:hypothetical protein [Roseateles depolymerans]|uniref:Uncharacterized protein n=1 Tax=Roseateles depolymerans TaxID=76731 RepID=A0A0U3MGT0_9BURK|nr:hypothetical protein [Roseateles depolymerans]ALV06700.1 hypothetical protein RD2015_2228 [Roseateles depolymerans]REG19677.1 hypothetical protein DES44_2177 [Roseateles depolymerans]